MAKSTTVRVRHLNILLIKDGITEVTDCLKEDVTTKQIKMSSSIRYAAEFHYQSKKSRSPAWLDFIGEGLASTPEVPSNDNLLAVLFVRESRRVFAVTFGHGRSLLRPDCFERDFGLRVVLNSVDPTQLRSIDARTVEELTLHTRRQASRGSPLETFSINVHQDILRLLTGKPINPNLASRIVGSDSLLLSVKLQIEQLGDKCKELLKAYKSQEYQKHFPWFDHLRAERDPSQVDRLNEELVERLRLNQLEDIHLAPPEVMDWELVEGISFSTEKDAAPRHDLLVEDYLKTLKDPSKVSMRELKKHQLQIHPTTGGNPITKWRVYDSIVLEIEDGDELYVLSCGDWFRVAKSFAARIREKVRAIKTSDLVLPAARRNEREDAFNARTAAVDKTLALMDRKNGKVQGARTHIEVCDLFTRKRQFVHVKRKTKSATLSHLFSQGVVAAESFLMDEELRNHARNRIAATRPTFASLIPKERPAPGEFEVVFAIIAKQNAKWPLSLPFFSQLSLSHACDRLARMGYLVSLLRVDEL